MLPGPTADQLIRRGQRTVGAGCFLFVPAVVLLAISGGVPQSPFLIASMVCFVLGGLVLTWGWQNPGASAKEAEELAAGYTTRPRVHLGYDQVNAQGNIVRTAERS
ncbi:MAG: hypothetical protein BGO97_11750 [Micrococcales bacterium 70-64]|nr:MAG: hypothetical protein ABT06_11750 [Leifsonia sp. SCN 70-46]OJX86331.1 MAG: hypothetical protein BGO97_11750 [Micrococcales bacterium 70-64]